MTLNPIYFDLTKNSKLVPKPGKSFILIPLANREDKFFNFRGISYRLDEQHLTVHEKFSHKNPAKSPIHYTAVYVDRNLNELTMHGFYNEFGEFILAQLRFEGSKKTESLNGDEEAALDNLMKLQAKPQLKPLFNKLFDSQKAATTKKESILDDLVEESHQGVNTDTYISKLEVAIRAIDDANNIDFFPCYEIRNKLNDSLTFLKKNRQDNIKEALKSKAKPPKLKIKNSLLEETPSTDSVTSEPTTSSPVEVKSEITSRLSLMKLTEKELYLKLKECPLNNVNLMFMITKAIDNYNKNRIENLVQACIDGNLENLEKFFKESDLMLIPILLSTAVNHNNLGVFAYLYEKNKFKNLDTYITPYLSAFPLMLDLNNSVSLTYLGLACFKRYFEFVKVLLNTYKVDPDDYYVTGIPIISQLIVEKAPKEYIETLLEAKANPNMKLQTNFKVVDLFGSGELFNPEQKEAIASLSEETPLYYAVQTQNRDALRLLLEHKADPNPSIPDDSLLYRAVRLGDAEAVELLLEHKACPDTIVKNDTPLRAALSSGQAPIVQLLLNHGAQSNCLDEKKFTPFAEVTHVLGRPVNKDVVQVMIQSGHNIDQRQGPDQTTGLYYQCQIGNIEGVKTLLDLGAKPDAPHILKSLLSTHEGSPLAIAANKKFLSIVKELLKYNPSSKAIGQAYKMCDDLKCREELRLAYFNTSNKEAVEAFKAENYNLAEPLFIQALDYTQHDNERHSINYNYAVCLLEQSKKKGIEKQTKAQALAKAFGIFKSLESSKINDSLLKKVQNRIAQISDAESRVYRP